jgi:hypothetical protein
MCIRGNSVPDLGPNGEAVYRPGLPLRVISVRFSFQLPVINSVTTLRALRVYSVPSPKRSQHPPGVAAVNAL